MKYFVGGLMAAILLYLGSVFYHGQIPDKNLKGLAPAGGGSGSTASTSTFSGGITTVGSAGIGTSSPQGNLSVQGNSSGSATKGTCFRAKDVGANTFTYWYYKAGVQTASTKDCGGTSTTTITYD